jgi:hypothetical protein
MKMNFIKNHIFLVILILLSILIIPAAYIFRTQPDETVLVRVGDKTITLQEFMRRSELTVRPGPFKSKKTTLNNLISEKILALEAESEMKSESDPLVAGTLKGIQEQLMRDHLFKEVAYNTVVLDTNEVAKIYKLSQREYEVEFYTTADKKLAQKMEVLLDSVPELSDQMFAELQQMAGKKPVHTVNYKDQDDDVIREVLYSQPMAPGTVIGPLRLSNGEYIIMKVLNWVEYPVIGMEAQQVHWNKVKEKLHQIKANEAWRSYQTQVMKGKNVEFDPEVFANLSRLAMETYLNTDTSDSLRAPINDIPLAGSALDPAAPFFTLDNKVWTIGDFKKALLSHPLVFRTRYIDRNNFRKHFRLAIGDMIRDHFLTGEAYDKSLDRSEDIQQTVEMWRDALHAMRKKQEIIADAVTRGLVKREDKSGMSRYWEEQVRILQDKYSGSIQINTGLLDTISLTRVDLIAMKPGVPYPMAVPTFPTLIASDNLDYIEQGKRQVNVN